MNTSLTHAGYVLDPQTGVWMRDGYRGIAYSDGDEVERRLASIVREAEDLSVLSRELRRHCTDWPTMYHLAGTRANVLRPFRQHLRGDVLEIGAGCGAITRFLGECGAKVLALEGTPRRASIARLRTRDLSNVDVVSESFEDFQPTRRFDVITLIGVLEYANLFVQGSAPHLAMLQRAAAMLKPGGRIIVAIENQLGLKYLAGAPEDHLGIPMYGVEGRYTRGQVQTFGRVELSDLMQRAGMASVQFFAPFPDYKLPVSVLAEAADKTEAFDAASFAWQSVHRDPQLPKSLSFSPELAWPVVARNRLLIDLANSFIVVARDGVRDEEDTSTLAWHFSTDRKKEYCKETRFVSVANGSVHVEYESLAPSSASSGPLDLMRFSVPASSDYARGRLMSQELVALVSRDGWNMQAIGEFLTRYLHILSAFIGDIAHAPHSAETPIDGAFFDAVPYNIVLPVDGPPQLIDKEWSLSRDVSLGYLVFRSISFLFTSVTRFGVPKDPGIRTPMEFMRAAFESIGFEWTPQALEGYVKADLEVNEIVTGERLDVANVLASLSTHDIAAHAPVAAMGNDEVRVLREELARVEEAKAVAEGFAYSRQHELEQLHAQLAVTTDAKNLAERLALERHAHLGMLTASRAELAQAESRLSVRESELMQAESRLCACQSELLQVKGALHHIRASRPYRILAKLKLVAPPGESGV